jgi:hypothetical protein
MCFGTRVGQYFAQRARVQDVSRPFLAASPMRWDDAVAALHAYLQQPATLLTPP